MARYAVETMLRAVERYRVTHLYVVPPVVIALAKQPELVASFDVSSVREIGSGAAPLGKEVMEECARLFPLAVLFQVTVRDNYVTFFFSLLFRMILCANFSTTTFKDKLIYII